MHFNLAERARSESGSSVASLMNRMSSFAGVFPRALGARAFTQMPAYVKGVVRSH